MLFVKFIVIDEAHLYTDWCSFRSAFTDLKNFKYNFPDTPIMALTATAKPVVDEIKIPVIEKASKTIQKLLEMLKNWDQTNQFLKQCKSFWDYGIISCHCVYWLHCWHWPNCQFIVRKWDSSNGGTMERWMLTPDVSLICSGSQGKPRQ